MLYAPLNNVTRTFSIIKKEVDHKKTPKTIADRILLHVRCMQTPMTFACKWLHFGRVTFLFLIFIRVCLVGLFVFFYYYYF